MRGAISTIESIEQAGYAIVPNVADEATVAGLIRALDAPAAGFGRRRGGSVYAVRNLLEVLPEAAAFARSDAARRLVEPILGRECFAVRGILFDKTPDANWKVVRHQDLTIAVRERLDAPGFGPWTIKEGVLCVQPPPEILERMLTLRLHLDDCFETNGPLQALPGSHRFGRLSAERIAALSAETPFVPALVGRGGALLMRPLLLHSSSAASVPGRRRVLHIEYAGEELPSGLQWRTRL